MLEAGDIAGDVRQVLAAANAGKGEAPPFLTAYQILERLPATTRDRALAERGMPGAGAGVHYSAASLVKDAILHHLRTEVEIACLDNTGAAFEIEGRLVRGGYPVCGLYRLARPVDLSV